MLKNGIGVEGDVLQRRSRQYNGGSAAVFNLNASDDGSDSSSSDSNSSSDSSSDSGSDDDPIENHDVLPHKYDNQTRDIPDDKAWGKKKDFYGDDDSDDAQNSEEEDMMVEEATRLQKAERADVSQNDYGLSDDSSSSSEDSDDESLRDVAKVPRRKRPRRRRSQRNINCRTRLQH